MSSQLKVLLDLQNIDLELARAQKARANLDDGSEKKRQVDLARQEYETAKRLLHEATSEMQDKELNLKSTEAKQKSFRDKLYGGSVTSPKELESIEKEIEMLGRQKGKLEEHILELYDIVEERKAALAAAESALKQQEDELTALLEKRQQEDASLAAKIQELSVRREEAAKLVDAALLKRYEALRSRSGGVVVSKVEDDRCSACHTQITGYMMRMLKSNEDIETCENCGRMLYLEQ